MLRPFSAFQASSNPCIALVLMGGLCTGRQVLILDKALEVVQKLDDLPECSTVYSLDWLSETLALVCTDKACVYWNLTEDPPEAQLFGEDEMKITSAACSKDLKRLCVGTANGHVRHTQAAAVPARPTGPLPCS